MATKNTKRAKQNRPRRFAEARGYAAPLCPRCTNMNLPAAMEQNMSTLNWHCSRCSTTWNSYYLQGWNDGHRAARHNDEAQARRT